MRIFISQPMRGKTEEQVREDRLNLINLLKKRFDGSELVFIDNIFEFNESTSPLSNLSRSLMLLSTADLAVFTHDWCKYRGCRIEYKCAEEYNINMLVLGEK